MELGACFCSSSLNLSPSEPNDITHKMYCTSIVRPANRDRACQTERCHTLSNKTSPQ